MLNPYFIYLVTKNLYYPRRPGEDFFVHFLALIEFPTPYLLPTLLSTLVFFLLLLGVPTLFILILLYVLGEFPNILMIITEMFSRQRYCKFLCHQLYGFFDFDILLRKTSPTPNSMNMQFIFCW